MFSWVPPLGYKNLSDDPKGWFLTLIIPWITLAILYIGLYGRVLRASLIEAMQEDYIRTARAKGLSETRILLRHALRTSLISFVTLFGLDFGALVGGSALLTEVVFNLQGVGKLTYDALQNLDLPDHHDNGDVCLVLCRHGQCPGRRGLYFARPPREGKLMLSVRDLRVSFRTEQGLMQAIDGVSFDVEEGEILGVVGESGSGKTVSLLAVMGLINDPNAVIEGSIKYRGRELVGLPPPKCASCGAAKLR